MFKRFLERHKYRLATFVAFFGIFMIGSFLILLNNPAPQLEKNKAPESESTEPKHKNPPAVKADPPKEEKKQDVEVVRPFIGPPTPIPVDPLYLEYDTPPTGEALDSRIVYLLELGHAPLQESRRFRLHGELKGLVEHKLAAGGMQGAVYHPISKVVTPFPIYNELVDILSAKAESLEDIDALLDGSHPFYLEAIDSLLSAVKDKTKSVDHTHRLWAMLNTLVDYYVKRRGLSDRQVRLIALTRGDRAVHYTTNSKDSQHHELESAKALADEISHWLK